MAVVRLYRRASDELSKLDPQVRDRIVPVLRQLDDPPANLDIKPLSGHKPWRRLRVGDWRVLYRRATTPGGQEVVLIARIIHRSDLERAVQQL